MNEDESFIRAVVDSPGDDTARLVYADWLDDRDDPRGSYLRAERETVETGDIARLRALAAGLDPVWVARVSLPPVGVCLQHVELTERGPRVTESDIARVEEQLGVPLPAEYRAFLLNYNGGYIDAALYFNTPDGPLAMHDCGWRLYPLDRIGRFTLRPGDVFPSEPSDHRGMPPLAEPAEDWVSRFIVIGHNPDYIGGMFFGVSGNDRGQLRILDTSVELENGIRYNAGQPPYATSLPDFFDRLNASMGTPIPDPLPAGEPGDQDVTELGNQEIPF